MTTAIMFDKLIVRNFRMFVGEHELTLDNGAGLLFLRGKNKLEPSLEANDAGKSTLWAAFCWCLWGRAPKGLRGPDFKPWGSKKGSEPTRVVVHFHVNDKPHRIERTTETNGLRLDGKSCGQNDIERLLQMSFEIFINTVLLAQGRDLFFDLEPAKKLALFVEALDLDKWDKRSVAAADNVRGLEAELAKYEGEKQATQATLDEARRNMDQAKKRADTWQEDHDAFLTSLNNQLDAAEAALDEQAKLRDKSDLEYDGAGTEVKMLKSEAAQLMEQSDAIRKKHNMALVKIEGARSALRQLNADLIAMGQNDRCPTCNQKITGTSLDKHKGELKRRIATTEEMIEAGVPVAIEKEMETFKKAYQLVDQRQREFERKADDALSAFKRLSGIVSKHEADVRVLKSKIETEEAATNAHGAEHKRLKRDVATIKGNLDSIEDDIKETHKLIERTKPWVKGFKEIRLYVVDEILQELEIVTNAMLPDVGLDGWRVQYDVEKETKSGTIQRGLNVTVLSPRNDEPVKWEVWGGGVGQRLRIVGALALSEVLLNYAGVSINLEILDEPARHMSKGGVRDLCDYLAQRALNLDRTIWFVDHMSVESDKFTDVATIVKDKGGSQIVWS